MRLDYRVIADWIRPEASVLDLGCGDGELLSILVKEKGVRANGIEIDEQAIYKCVERGLSVFHEDIEEGLSGYPDDSFDYVIMNDDLNGAFEHLAAIVLAERSRRARKAHLAEALLRTPPKPE